MLLVRMIKGKENINSIKSRLGIYRHCEELEGQRGNLRTLCYYWVMRLPRSSCSLAMMPRANHADKLIWVHAASVGECMIAMTLVGELKKKYQNAEFLITTGTLSSASIINKWLPEGVHHQFTPLDNWFMVRRFYKYWQPSLGIFVESELWPTLVSQSVGKCKLLLLNARLSDKSFQRWQKFPKLFSILTNFFSLIAVQSDVDFAKYQSLGCNNLKNLGNLKFANQELTVNKAELRKLEKIFKGKKILVASSTHVEDESVILDIITRVKTEKNNIYSIMILRHPERRDEIAAKCEKAGLKYTLRSSQKLPGLKDDLYIVDSFGELGLFYSLSDVVFIGGSFKRGGHNLLEPAYFDNVIIVGPDMSNFQNIADEMIANKAALQVKNSAELQEKIMFFTDDKNAKISQEYSDNAKNYVDNKEKILANYLNQIGKFYND
jgi:3-deoxy-D-manno-octulosonic-acid transferase